MTPGEYLYSIGGFTVAGAMLEAATNKTFEQLMTEVGQFRLTKGSDQLKVFNERGGPQNGPILSFELNCSIESF